MNKLSKYFINLIKDYVAFPDSTMMCIKNFKIDKSGKIYWDESDKPPINARQVSILGLSHINYLFDYFNVSNESSPVRRSHAFQHYWAQWGTFVFNINGIKPGPIYSFLENVFLQMMHEVEQGKNVFIGNDLFIEKNSAYQHMMKADLLDIE